LNRRLAGLVIIVFVVAASTITGICLWSVKHASDDSKERLDAAARFIYEGFNPELNLVSEAPEAAPDVYWLVSDTLLAQYVLKEYYPDVAGKIKSRLIELASIYGLPTNSEGLPVSFKHEAVLGEEVPLPFNITNFYDLETGDSYAMKTEVLNQTVRMPDWQEYVDSLCYAALTRYYQNNMIGADHYFRMVASMWDGKGLADKGFWWSDSPSCGRYETCKLALLLFTSKILGIKLSHEENLSNRIWACQNEDGGIITHYPPDGRPDPEADANTETTALVLVAKPKATLNIRA